MHVALKLLSRGDAVLGIDNLNSYYDPRLKRDRLKLLECFEGFGFDAFDIENNERIASAFRTWQPDRVIHLAAQAGVRYSIENPHAYIQSNVVGFVNVLEACRTVKVDHLVYASSSSVYGGNTRLPFSEHQNIDHPVSLYAATKKSNELMAHTYSHLFGLPTTGLRFFTVYGPWGRPDMALFKFTKSILAGHPIDVYNHGKMIRDFTYIDDICEGVIRCLDRVAEENPLFESENPDPATARAPYRVFNIGNNNPIPLMEFIGRIEESLQRKAEFNFLPMQDGDVPATSADVSELEKWTGFRPQVSTREGVGKFIAWYLEYYGRAQ